MLSAFYHWMLSRDIEVLVYYIRSHHNLSADLLTRGYKDAITTWMSRYNMTQIRLPWRWEAFAKTGACQVWTCAKRPNYWLPPTNKPHVAGIVVGEWNGSNFAPLYVAQRLGFQAVSINSRLAPDNESDFDVRIPRATNEINDVVIGTSKSVRECLAWFDSVRIHQPEVSIFVTNSEISPDRLAELVVTQHYWIDSFCLGDVLGGAWNVFVKSAIPLIGLRSDVIGAYPHTIADWYERVRIPCLDGHGEISKTYIENSRGRMNTCQGPVYGQMLHISSQMPPLAKREVQESLLSGPWRRSDKGLTLVEKLSLVGCHDAWYVRPSRTGESIGDAIWRTSPTTIWRTLLEEVGAKWAAICHGAGALHYTPSGGLSTVGQIDATSDVETESQMQANATPDDSPVAGK